MRNLESFEAVHTHTHTGYIRKINKKGQKKNIKLYSNMLFLAYTKRYVENNVLLSSFLCFKFVS